MRKHFACHSSQDADVLGKVLPMILDLIDIGLMRKYFRNTSAASARHAEQVAVFMVLKHGVSIKARTPGPAVTIENRSKESKKICQADPQKA